MNKSLKEQAHGRSNGSSESFSLKTAGSSGRTDYPLPRHAGYPAQKQYRSMRRGRRDRQDLRYLTACILLKKFAPHGPAGSQPVVVSTSSVALQDAIIGEYIPFLSRIFLENRIIQKPIRAMVRKGKERFVCDARLAGRLEAVREKKKNAEQMKALLSLRSYYDLDA